MTCDPKDHPTSSYINQYMEYYTNGEASCCDKLLASATDVGVAVKANITTWPDDLWPKNSLIDDC